LFYGTANVASDLLRDNTLEILPALGWTTKVRSPADHEDKREDN